MFLRDTSLVSEMRRRDPGHGEFPGRWLDTQVLRAFKGGIFNIDLAVAERRASLHVPARRPLMDAFMAAAAWMTVVTRDIRYFEGPGVAPLNPSVHPG